MSFGDWDAVERDYREIYLHGRMAENAKGILELIPKIKGQVYLQDVSPGISHGDFFLSRSEGKGPKKPWVKVRCVQLGIYEICMSDRDRGDYDEVIVKDEEIVQVLQEYVRRLRTQNG
jgi:hypothetical protein